MGVRRILIGVFFGVTAVLLGSSPAASTSCDPPRDDGEATRTSAVAIDGVPIAWDGSTRRLTVEVVEVLKGDVGDTVSLFTNAPIASDDGVSIPWQYELGQPYRIYVHTTDAGLTTGGCSGNRPAAVGDAAQPAPSPHPDVGDAAQPAPPPDAGDRDRAPLMLVTVVVAAAAATAAGLAAAWLTSRHRRSNNSTLWSGS